MSPQKLLLLSLLVFLGCREQIVHNLSEPEANRLLTRLHQGQIEATKVTGPDGSWALEVDKNNTIAALTLLEQSRIFQRSSSKANDDQSFLASREDQHYRLERALGAEIETTLNALDQVLEARVHLKLPQSELIFNQPTAASSEGSASVLVIAPASTTLTEDQIRGLVAGASGVARDKIAVILSLVVQPAQKSPVTEIPAVTVPSYSSGAAFGKSSAVLALGLGFLGMGLLSVTVFRRRKKIMRVSA